LSPSRYENITNRDDICYIKKKLSKNEVGTIDGSTEKSKSLSAYSLFVDICCDCEVADATTRIE
jgi:hypothetical protein